MCHELMDVMYENLRDLLGKNRALNVAEPMTGSTDAGDVSMLLPTLHAGFGGISGALHSAEVEITDRELAYVTAAKGLALTVVDLLCDGAKKGLEIRDNYQPPMTKAQYLKEWGKK